MILVCVRDFGNFVPGYEVEVEDGVQFDSYHFEAKPVSFGIFESDTEEKATPPRKDAKGE